MAIIVIGVRYVQYYQLIKDQQLYLPMNKMIFIISEYLVLQKLFIVRYTKTLIFLFFKEGGMKKSGVECSDQKKLTLIYLSICYDLFAESWANRLMSIPQ